MRGTNEISSWARVVGVPLRPWSGTSPTSLIIRGLLSLVVSVALAYIFIRMLQPDSGIGGMAAGELSFLKTVLIPAIIVAALSALFAVLRIVVGVLDLAPRRTVHGTVVSLRERKMGDFLPHFVQQQIWNRGPHVGHDRRRTRTELVLDTSEGTGRWTIRNRKQESSLVIGRPVTIKVSPLVGYVSDVTRR